MERWGERVSQVYGPPETHVLSPSAKLRPPRQTQAPLQAPQSGWRALGQKGVGFGWWPQRWELQLSKGVDLLVANCVGW